MQGNTGKVIDVDLTGRSVKIASPPDAWYHGYIGGSGLAARLFWEMAHFDADPLSPEAILIFMNGPFAGLKLSGASRSSVGGRSPLTGNWGDSSCGGYFGPELRYAGYDGIVLRGRTASCVWAGGIRGRHGIEEPKGHRRELVKETHGSGRPGAIRETAQRT